VLLLLHVLRPYAPRHDLATGDSAGNEETAYNQIDRR